MRGAAESGAILGGGTDEDIAALSKYGENIGIAFQIEDDILDFTGEKGKIKKPPGEDAKNKIITLPIIFALKDKKEIEEILNSSEEKFDRLLEIVKKTGALDKSKLVANRYVEEAKKCLATLKESNAKACLMKLADFSVTRKW
jgi:geranylgeranyl pyrophosphate synthase